MMIERQRGNTVLGFLGGLILGLSVAVLVAVYVTRAPVPFVNRQPRPSERVIEPPRSAAEAPDPNKSAQATRPRPGAAESSAILGAFNGQNQNPPVAPPNQASGNAGQVTAAPSAGPAPANAAPPRQANAPAPVEARTQPTTSSPPQQYVAAGRPNEAPRTADAPRAGEPPSNNAEKSAYFLQAGSYSQQTEADAMKAKLALAGFEGKVLAAEVNGQKVYRVRVGPFSQFDEMNAVRSKISENGVSVAVVRQR